MGSWQAEQRLHQKDGTRTPWGGRPPPSPDIQSVPKWERTFCNQIPWSKFCERKKSIHLFPKVLDWDDSAGKEAFENAKFRYRADINGVACKAPIPNPDMYIDVVDHETPVDPRLLQDLYKEPPPPPPPPQETVDYDSVKITPTGWDVEDPDPPISNVPRFIIAETSRWDGGTNLSTEDGADENSATIRNMPTGWGDEDAAWGRRENDWRVDGERLAGGETGAARNGGLHGQGWADESPAWRKVGSWEHRERVSDAQDGRHRRRGGGWRARHVHPRPHELGHGMDVGWKDGSAPKRYGSGHHWHEKSAVERGLSCAPVSHW